MSDRIAVMHAGKVEQIGLPEELYDRPSTRFVADFMGTTNLLKGRVEAIDGSIAVIRLDGGDACRAVVDGLATGRRAARSRSGRRPSRSPAPARAVRASIEGRVEQAAYLGASVQYQVRSQGGALMSVVIPKTGRRFVAGDDVEIGWSPGDALVVGRPAPSEEDVP